MTVPWKSLTEARAALTGELQLFAGDTLLCRAPLVHRPRVSPEKSACDILQMEFEGQADATGTADRFTLEAGDGAITYAGSAGDYRDAPYRDLLMENKNLAAGQTVRAKFTVAMSTT